MWEFRVQGRERDWGLAGPGKGLEATFPLSWGVLQALTDGHVVAAVRESGVPVTELGLVAAAGTLGLTGHWVGHGCEGSGPGSAGSPSASPAPHIPAASEHLPLPGSPGRATRPPAEGTPLHLPLPFCHCHICALPPQSVPVATASCTSGWAVGGELMHVWGRVGATSGWGRDVLLRPPHLGLGCWVPAFPGASGVQSGAICLRSRGAQGREAAGFRGLEGLLAHPVIPPLPFTLSCISNCILLALGRWRWGRQR